MINPEIVRPYFPALSSGAIHFDNPGGTQIAQQSLQRMEHYLQHSNANHGGAFRTSIESDAVVAETRQALADWFNAARPEEIVFGANMTSLTLHFSRSIARTLHAGDEIILTRMDHDANVAPWLMVAEDRGALVRFIDFDPEDCRLDLASLERMVSARTKLVAIGYASNALGTINDVQRAAQMAHSVGALCYVDAVQYAAHGPIDVQALDCDFLVCSAYKYFGPHIGVLYGKYRLLDELSAYKVRTSSTVPPEKWETGTQSFESIASTLGALDYLQWLGETFGADYADPHDGPGRRQTYKRAMRAIKAYERTLTEALIDGLNSVPGMRLYGLTEPELFDVRVPTVACTLDGWQPRQIAEKLAAAGICVTNGNFYALEVSRRLGVAERGGLLRIGAVHYNTVAEIEQLVSLLRQMKS